MTLPVLLATCGGDGSPEARRELAALERALGALEAAHPEDRSIRLEEIERLPCADPRVVELRDLCASSYRAFSEAAGLLAEARARTARAEATLASLGGEGDAGAPAGQAREELAAVSRAARDSLSAVTRSLDKAEELVKACEARRESLRGEFTAR